VNSASPTPMPTSNPLNLFFPNSAENPALGFDASNLREGYRRFIHKRHTINYQALKSGIMVVRILGPGMAAEHHL